MSEKDLYKILDLEPGSDQKAITRAYRKLAMKWHPDKNAGSKEAEAKFKEIKWAYEVLSGKIKYKPKEESKPEPPKKAYQKPQTNTEEPPVYRKKLNLPPEAEIKITLLDVELGTIANVEKKTFCGSCHGSGRFSMMTSPVGQMMGFKVPYASVKDKTEDRCPLCKGTGELTLFKGKFIVPPGVEHGQVYKLYKDNEFNWSPNYSRNILIRVENHKFISRIGDDIYLTLFIDHETLKNGGQRQVEILSRTVNLNIPAGLPNNQILKYRDLGLPNCETGVRGSAYITLELK